MIKENKNIIDKYISLANRNARRASEIGLTDSMKMHQYYRDLFKELKEELYGDIDE